MYSHSKIDLPYPKLSNIRMKTQLHLARLLLAT